MFLQQFVNGLVVGSIYALTAAGASMVYGILRILDIANAGAYAIGAYTGWLIYGLTGNILVSFIGAMIITGIFGFITQKSLYLPQMKQSAIVPLITSIGLFIFIEDSLRLIFGAHIKDFAVEVPIGSMVLLNANISGIWILILLVTSFLFLILWWIIVKTKIGLGWRATAQDMEIAQAMGVNTKQLVALNFFLGYGFAAIAGIMVGIYYNSIFPNMGDVPAYKMLAIIVLGGLGNPFGTVIAALFIGLIETFIGGYIGFFLPRDAIAFLALILIILLKPQGLFAKNN